MFDGVKVQLKWVFSERRIGGIKVNRKWPLTRLTSTHFPLMFPWDWHVLTVKAAQVTVVPVRCGREVCCWREICDVLYFTWQGRNHVLIWRAKLCLYSTCECMWGEKIPNSIVFEVDPVLVRVKFCCHAHACPRAHTHTHILTLCGRWMSKMHLVSWSLLSILQTLALSTWSLFRVNSSQLFIWLGHLTTRHQHFHSLKPHKSKDAACVCW